MCALYAFLRIADDIGDGPGTAREKYLALDDWRVRLDWALAGEYSHRSHAALHHAVQRFRIPDRYLLDTLDGVEMDIRPVQFPTFADLYAYCYRVASAVGLACIHIWGFAHSNALIYAERAGIGIQLTNILRDLAEDSRNDRFYLPSEDFERYGYSTDDLRCHVRNQQFRNLMEFQVSRAREFYTAASPLTQFLNAPGRAVFTLMTRTYSRLLDEIELRDYDVFARRVSVPSWRKLWLTAQALPVRCGWR
jgi:phytoene synthase